MTAGSQPRADDHRGQRPEVDVPAAQDDPDPASREALQPRAQGRDPGRTGALDDQLLLFEQLRDRGLDRRLANQDRLAHRLPDDGQRETAHPRDRDPFGDRHPARDRPALARRRQRGVELALHRDHAGR